MTLSLVVAAVELIFQTLAGPATGGGFRDGTGTEARFSAPRDVTVCRSGDIFVADTGNDAIRKVTPAGVVTTLATGFSQPLGITSDADCNLFVADTLNDVVKRVSNAGTVSTFASGFNRPQDVAFGPDGMLYVADTGNHAIRTVSSSGVVANFATVGQPISIAVDSAGVVYAVDRAATRIVKITGTRIENVDPTPIGVGDMGLAVAADGTVYIADSDTGTIRRAAAGLPVIAGVAATRDLVDGPASTAHFRGPTGIAATTDGRLVISETGNQTIRLIEGGQVLRLAGSSPELGSADGPGEVARFRSANGLSIDKSGNIYVGDQNGLRKVTPSGVVTTISHVAPGTFLAVDANGNVYGSSFSEHVIYKTTPDGTRTVFAGSVGAVGRVDARGSAARFQNPRGLGIGSDGSLYVGDAGSGLIRKITPAGDVTTVKTGVGPAVNLIVDTDDTIYFVAEGNPAKLQQLTRDATLTVLATFNDYSTLHEPRVARAPDGTFYMIDVNTSAMRKITGNGTEIVAGVDQGPGNENGSGSTARFDLPREIAFGPDGRLYFTDAGNHNIRVAAFGSALSITSFTTLPPRIAAGGSVTLKWDSNGGRSARIDPGVGEVPLSGSIVVSPSATTPYTLTVHGDTGEVNARVVVAVGAAPPRRRAVNNQ